jgi:hypothetical protein
LTGGEITYFFLDAFFFVVFLTTFRWQPDERVDAFVAFQMFQSPIIFKNEQKCPILYTEHFIFDTQDPILDAQYPTFHTQHPIFDTQYQILDARYQIYVINPFGLFTLSKITEPGAKMIIFGGNGLS